MERADIRKERYNLDELRGLACCLLVGYHVVGVPGAGMHVDDASWYRHVVSSFELIRMPLFTFLSGLVYAFRPASADSLPSFYAKKARRLLIPFVTVSTLFYMAQKLTGAANEVNRAEEIWTIYLFPYAHFWYLQALCLIVLVIGFLDANTLISRARPFAIAFALAIAGCLTIRVPGNPFAIEQALFLLPHFMLGIAVIRFPKLFGKAEVYGLAALMLALAIGTHQTILMAQGHGYIGWNSPLAILCGMCAAIVLLWAMPASPLLRRVGTASYAIYLHHAFCVAGTRIILMKVGAPDIVVFLACLTAGLIGPIIFRHLASMRPLTRVALVG